MKCPKCNGRGKTTEYDGLRKFWCDYKCEMCNGTGEVDMTNEEWLRSCDTEQLAEFLHKTTIACFVCGMDGLDEKRCPFGLECAGPKDILKWLKQKHNE